MRLSACSGVFGRGRRSAQTSRPGASNAIIAGCAREYARRRTRDSVESLRARTAGAAQLRRLWLIYGESCFVAGDSYGGSDEIDYFIARRAKPEERDYASPTPSSVPFRQVALKAAAAWQQSFSKQGGKTEHEEKIAAAAVQSLRDASVGTFRFAARIVTGEAEPDQEWHEATQHWSLEIGPHSVTLERWLNMASMVGASQFSEIAATGAADSFVPQAALEWLSSLDSAFQSGDCHRSATGAG